MQARRILAALARNIRYDNWPGYCPICEAGVRFYAVGEWYRDQLLCGSCHSIPRQRALISVLTDLYPNWRDLAVHESSPGNGGASAKLKRECPGYVSSQYTPDLPPSPANQDLAAQSFPDASFDLVITQDVFEHLFEPDRVIAEIARTLKPGGAHIMSVPIVNKDRPTQRRASLVDGAIVHHAEPEYHGNPVDPNGSLVTFDWGYDIAAFLEQASAMPTRIVTPEDRSQGLLGEYLDIVVSEHHTASLTAPALLNDRLEGPPRAK